MKNECDKNPEKARYKCKTQKPWREFMDESIDAVSTPPAAHSH